MKLGRPEISLAVADIKASLAFYEALGFKRVEGAEEEKRAVVAQPDLRIGLYEGHVDANSLTFFGVISTRLRESFMRQVSSSNRALRLKKMGVLERK